MSAEKPASLRSLVSDASRDAQHLFKVQKELASVEMSASGKAAGATGGLFTVAAMMAAIGGLFLLLTLAFVLYAIGLPLWASFGIVTLTLFLIAGIAGVVGRSKAKEIKGIPLAKAEIERTKAALSGATSTEVAVPTGRASVPAGAKDAS